MSIRQLYKMVFLLLVVEISNAQDTIFLRNGTLIPAKVAEIFSDSVIFKTIDQADSVISVLSYDSISSIKYANGKTELYEKEKNVNKIINIADDPYTMFLRGRNDARIFYKGNGAFWGTFAATGPLTATTGSVYAIPFFGITVGSTFALTNPVKITIPDQNLLNNPDYIRGYMKQARKKRLANAVGGGFLGLGVDALLLIILFSSLSVH